VQARTRAAAGAAMHGSGRHRHVHRSGRRRRWRPPFTQVRPAPPLGAAGASSRAAVNWNREGTGGRQKASVVVRGTGGGGENYRGVSGHVWGCGPSLGSGSRAHDYGGAGWGWLCLGVVSILSLFIFSIKDLKYNLFFFHSPSLTT
jgi:hypothetical protein